MNKALTRLLFGSAAFSLLIALKAIAQEGKVGLMFEGFGLNSVQLNDVEYVGECPGLQKDSVKTRFVDSQVETAPDLRVSLINKSDGVNANNPPKKDTAYKKNGTSNAFSTRTSTRGGFGVISGVNTFDYKIYNKKSKETLSEGSVQVEAQTSVTTTPRNGAWQGETLICASDSSTVQNCPDGRLILEAQKVCPDGRVLDTSTTPFRK
ncbi:MAG: hypothetical protein KME35_18440 [Aphanocapsa sp. GSE-SYN-MK-11-07L]|jgi:hypothetical protein|nr:hypothetical protein [Aphanocapsa sp. GSE-SYN-MK-11-07L]